MRKTEVDTKKLRDELAARYIVQWVTEFDSNNDIIKVVGYCVRDKKSFGWTTLFRHESADVCEKVADMLNEEELTNVRRA
jgi:hypothetical protein